MRDKSTCDFVIGCIIKKKKRKRKKDFAIGFSIF